MRLWSQRAEPDLAAALRTYALGLRSAPGQVRLAGPGGGALNQMSWLALKGHDAAHLCREVKKRENGGADKWTKCQSKLC